MNEIHKFLESKSKARINIEKLHDIKITRGSHLLALGEDTLGLVIENGSLFRDSFSTFTKAITHSLILGIRGHS